MNKKEEVKNIIAFLKKAYKYLHAGGEGCWYREIGDQGLHLVAANLENEETGELEPTVKVAYNSDDLQCDYNWDWEMPMFKDTGDCAFVEIPISLDIVKQDANYLYKEIKAMNTEIKKGNLLLGGC